MSIASLIADLADLVSDALDALPCEDDVRDGSRDELATARDELATTLDQLTEKVDTLRERFGDDDDDLAAAVKTLEARFVELHGLHASEGSTQAEDALRKALERVVDRVGK